MTPPASKLQEDPPPGLEAWGYGDFFREQARALEAELAPGRVVGQHRREWDIAHASGVERAVLAGRRWHAGSVEEDDLVQPTIGDWVGFRRAEGSPMPVIEQVLARRTFLARSAPSLRGARQVIVANVDVIAVVAAFSAADKSQSTLRRSLHPRRIERFLTAMRPGGAAPLVLLNKADLVSDAERRAQELSSRLGVPVLPVSAVLEGGIDSLRQRFLPGQTLGLVGMSGVGKSSLVNRLLGRDQQEVGAWREEDARGKHTTTRRSMLRTADGVLLIDTPGLRELSLSEGRPSDLDAFEDIEALGADCKFRDCQHQGEPGCRVLEAVAKGELDPDRLRSFLTLAAEVRAGMKPEVKPPSRAKAPKQKSPKRGRLGTPEFDE